MNCVSEGRRRKSATGVWRLGAVSDPSGMGLSDGIKVRRVEPLGLVGRLKTYQSVSELGSGFMQVRRFGAAAIVAGIVGMGVGLAGGPVAAHVTVNPREAEQGGFAKLTFRAPTERAVPTTKIEVKFPETQPLAFVNVQPVTGWTYAVKKRTLAEPIDVFGEKVSEVVDTVTWSGGKILAGEFQEFSVSVGPLPTAASMTFLANQTYEDGEIVRWIEPTPSDGEEPEHPAPVLTLTPASQGEGATTTTAGSTTTSTTASTSGAKSEDGASQDDVDSAKTMSIVALVAGITGLVLGGGAIAVSRRRTS